MRKLAKTGVVVFVIGAAVYGVPAVWFAYPTCVPVQAPFHTEAGVVFRHDFTVRTAHTYFLEVGCRDIAPLDYSLSDFLSSGPSQPRIPCDISVQLSHQGKAIQSEHLDNLRPASFCDGTGYWHLAYVDLPSAGLYTLEITNRSDLTRLAQTGPVVRMDIGGGFYEDAIFTKLFALVISAPVCLVGALLFLLGLRSPLPAEPGASPNASPRLRSIPRSCLNRQ